MEELNIEEIKALAVEAGFDRVDEIEIEALEDPGCRGCCHDQTKYFVPY